MSSKASYSKGDKRSLLLFVPKTSTETTTTSSVIIKHVQCMLPITTLQENKYTIRKYVHYKFHFISFILTIDHQVAFL